MMMRKQTNEIKKDVLASKSKKLLVSASAGCGKTTIMVEKIVELVSSKQADLSQVLVVTFTNLAAGQMKQRIYDKLMSLPDRELVREQVEKIDEASISTIHKFCIDVLKNYFFLVDVDPAFEVAEEAVARTLKNTAIDVVFENHEKQQDELFLTLSTIFLKNRKQDGLKDEIEKIYEFARCQQDFASWWKISRENFVNFNKNNLLLSTAKQNLLNLLAWAKSEFETIAKKAIDTNLEQLCKISQNNATVCSVSKNVTIESLFNLCKSATFESFRRNKNHTDEQRKVVEEFLNVIKRTTDNKYFALTKTPLDELILQTQQLVPLTDKLVELVLETEQEFSKLKAEKGILDFSDLEHKTLEVFKHDVAKTELQQKYVHVFVDEYQDVNGVQEAILLALQGEENSIFMVGDLKQSIYGFRQSDPDLFVEKYETFGKIQNTQKEELYQNFRSHNDVLKFVNTIFSVVMRPDFGRIDYKNDACLQSDLNFDLTSPAVVVDFIKKTPKSQVELDEIYPLTLEGETEETTQDLLEAKVILNRINSYVGKEHVVIQNGKEVRKTITYGDVVILSRNMTNATVQTVYDFLIKNNVPITATTKAQGVLSKEIRDVINLFKTIDNPLDDVAFVGTCLSFWGKFSENELAKIAIVTDKTQSFYQRALDYCENVDDEITKKIKNLFEFVFDLKFLSQSLNVDELILTILKKSLYHFYVQGLPNGSVRIKKLYTFIDLLKDNPQNKSIEKFLQHVQAEESSIEVEDFSTNAVRLLTIHASKGLEFPVVILCNTKSELVPKSENKADCVLCKNVGIGMNWFDLQKKTKKQSLGKFVCQQVREEKLREEEVRLLYVALTRAKNHLAIIMRESARQKASDVFSLKTQQDVIEYALTIRYGEKIRNTTNCGDNVQIEWHDENEKIVQKVAQSTIVPQQTDENELKSQIDYVYPHELATMMPSKITASSLDEYVLFEKDEQKIELSPFALAQEEKTAIGTAYHAVLEQIDFFATRNEWQKTISKVQEEHEIQIDSQVVFNVLENEEFKKIVEQGKVFRETPFLLKIDYNLIDSQKPCEKITLQGVIDMFVLCNDKAIIVDYKHTDHSDKIKQNYQNQINGYALAVSKICKIDNVEKYVLSIKDNKLIKM